VSNVVKVNGTVKRIFLLETDGSLGAYIALRLSVPFFEKIGMQVAIRRGNPWFLSTC